MHAKSINPVSHPILPYAEALEREHEENLLSPQVSPLADLLAQHSANLNRTARVVVVRRAGPARPFNGGQAVVH